MSITIDLAPDVEAQLREKAAGRGQKPEHYAAQVLTDVIRPAPAAPGSELPQTLAQMLAGRTGRVNSGGSQLARNAEKVFGDYLEEKRRQGRL